MLDQLRHHFGVNYTAVVLVMIAGIVTGGVFAATPRLRPHTFTALVIASIVLVVSATALPTDWISGWSTAGGLSLVPFQDTLAEISVLWLFPDSQAAYLWWLNVLVYLPLGLFARLALPSAGWRALLIPLVVSVLVEIWQSIALGQVGSTDDVIVNGVGTLLGGAAAVLVDRLTAAVHRRRVRR